MFNFCNFYSECSVDKIDCFIFGHMFSNRNNLALYAPSLNRFLFVHYDNNLLNKLRLLLSSKIRLEVVNLAQNTKNYNEPVLTNSNCCFFSPINNSGFGPTLLTFSNVDFKIEYNNNVDQDNAKLIVDLQKHIHFCASIINEYYYFFTDKSIVYNLEYVGESVNFLKEIGCDSTILENDLNHTKNKLFFTKLIEKALYFSNNKQDFINLIIQYIKENHDYIINHHQIEHIVISNFIERNIDESCVF